VIEMVFGHLSFDYNLLNFKADEKKKVSLKEVLDNDTYGILKANFSIGGSWDAEGNVVILAEGDGFYVIINNGWEMKVRTKDLNTGESRTIVANEKNPAIEAEGNNIAVRLLGIKGDGVSFTYPA
tara:strand:- start:326 stop:700 length:375 start_codon:yes stop_codon:yes gene_type:complete